jgi:hypothetical protein
MPFKSEKQRKFMWKNHPEIAEKWAHESGSPKPKKRAATKSSAKKKK